MIKDKKMIIAEEADQKIKAGVTLAEKVWAPKIKPLKEQYKEKKGTDLPKHLAATTAIALQNFSNKIYEETGGRVDPKRMLKEDSTGTYPDNVSNFIDYGFDIITSLIPTLAIDDVVSIQPMDREVGQVFFLDFIKDTTKGASTAGDDYINSKSGIQNIDYLYSTNEAQAEPVGSVLDSDDAFTVSSGQSPLIVGTVVVRFPYNGDTTEALDDGAGSFTGLPADATGSINYETGEITVNIAHSTPDVFDEGDVDIDYQYDMDRNYPPSVSLTINKQTIEAKSRRLRTNWLMEAAMSLQKAHGVDADEALMKATVGGISAEITAEVNAKLLSGATAGTFTFDISVPDGLSIMQSEWNTQIVDHCVAMANAIWRKTKRGYGNVIIAGDDMADLVMALPATFWKAEEDYKNPASGPHRVGILGGRWVVIHDPDYPADTFLMAYKGDTYLNAGYVFAPFIPLYSTTPVALDDTKVRRALGTSNGQAMINTNMFAIGKLTDIPDA